jgi:SAM-dependent methyltransferase
MIKSLCCTGKGRMDRHRLALAALSRIQCEQPLEKKPLLLLDAGAGERRLMKYIDGNKIKYISQDFGKYEGGGVPFDIKQVWKKRWASKSCDIICDITNIPLEAGFFDLITCFEVIEHLPDPIKCFQELGRLLKPGGTLLVTAPNLCAEHQNPYFYYSGFSKTFFISLVTERAKLKLLDIQVENDFITGHYSELHELRNQVNIITRLFVRIYLFCSRVSIKCIRYLPGFAQPESCSGYFLMYTK